MDKGTVKNRAFGISFTVLFYRIQYILPGKGMFQFKGNDGKAIQTNYYINTLAVVFFLTGIGGTGKIIIRKTKCTLIQNEMYVIVLI